MTLTQTGSKQNPFKIHPETKLAIIKAKALAAIGDNRPDSEMKMISYLETLKDIVKEIER